MKPLHNMNAYISVLMIGYALLSFKFFKVEDEVIGDAMNLAIILYTGCVIYTISSPNTDYFAMVLVGYIISKWFRCKSDEERGVLCLLGIFSVTVKLSSALIVVLAIPVIFKLAKDRKRKFIIICGIVSCITVSVFLVRNIIISGYILYPYAQLDFFNVDWKMPKRLVEFDHNEIIAWGRSLNDVRKYELGIESWFPIWWKTLTRLQMLLSGGNIICFIILGIECITCYRKHGNKSWIPIWITGVVCLLGWFFSAPLIRYGRIYLYIQPLILLGIVIKKIKGGRLIGMICYCVVGMYSVYLLGGFILSNGKIAIVYPEEYPEWSCSANDFQGVPIYTCEEGDRTGWNFFPAIPYKNTLETIELRGNSLREGFKAKYGD
ncbi:MAG: hypothetical protein K2O16_03840 [Lachnospiraceae bacterium]|nr:hypothetical protein [Lachnospiraceae bacterium]